MEVAALVVGIVGVVLATLSLIWQATTFLLTGPRVNVRLSEGLRAAHGGVVVGPLSIYPDASLTALEDDGYTEHIFAVTARNTGRLPATVSRWSLRFGNGATFVYPNEPHRLEPAADVSWYAPVAHVGEYVAAFVDQSEDARTVRGEVDLASGKTRRSRQGITVGADASTKWRHGGLKRALAWVRRNRLP